jgi:RHS repeat-associated protein
MEVTDEAGDLAWVGDYTAWGKVKKDTDHAFQARIEQPLRYPGQYEDESTGLHYNTMRYYDPDVGRFISQDPIGLMGGENLYAYAPNPTHWVDPLGLTGTPIVVIGEGQPAVDEATRLLRAQGYNAESMMVPNNQWRGGNLYSGMPDDEFAKAVDWNKSWLKGKIAEGYKVVDIGPDGRAIRSPFYTAEQQAIRELGVGKTKLKKFATGETVAGMRGRVAGSGGC